jgi:MFS family permease
MVLKRLFYKIFNQNLPRVYFELLFMCFNIMMGMSLSASFLPLLADRLDPQGVLVGLVVSVWYLSRMFIELPAGIISDRLGRRRLLVTGLGLSLLGPVLCSQASHIYVLIFGRGVWGMGSALYFMSNMALLMDILPSTSRGRALGMFQGIQFIGGFIGAPLGAWIATIISFTQVFYITTVFSVISLLIAFYSKEMKNIEDENPLRVSISIEDISTTLRNWNVVAVCLCHFFRMFMREGLDQTVLLLYLNKVRELGVAQIGWVVSVKIAGMIIFLLIAGVISDRYGRKPVLITGFIVSSLSLFMFTQAKNLPLLLLSGFIGGVGDGFDMSTLTALLTDISPRNARGVTVGLYRTFMGIGGFTGPIIFIIIYAELGYLVPFYIGISIFLLGTFIVSQVKN